MVAHADEEHGDRLGRGHSGQYRAARSAKIPGIMKVERLFTDRLGVTGEAGQGRSVKLACRFSKKAAKASCASAVIAADAMSSTAYAYAFG